jgi:AcrR family transcriptional regulator
MFNFKDASAMTKPTPLKKRDVTREKILDAALKLFQELGFEKTTMRAIANKCGLTPGATYYHFSYKEELVLEFYRMTSLEAIVQNQLIVMESEDFKYRFKAMVNFKFAQLLPYRELVHVLAGGAGDIKNPMSPFSAHSAEIRNDAIQMIEDVIEGSTIKVSSVLRPHLAKILWLYMMGIIFFWSNDQSRGQHRSTKLLDLSLEMVLRLLQVSNLPLLGGISTKAVQILNLVESCMQADSLGEEQSNA